MRFLCAVLLVIFLSAGAAMSAKKGNGFMFIQIADPQIGFSTNNGDLQPDIDHFQKAVEDVNRLRPAFVVISGDMINSDHDLKQIRAFWRVVKQISSDIPVYLVSGNHDLAPATESDVQSYRKLFGKDYYSFSFGGSQFIVLDSSVIHYPESDPDIRQTQRSWFEEQLASARKANANHIFVLVHHPWFINNPDEADIYENIPLSERKDYLPLMERYGVDFSVAGHYHKEAFARAGGLSMITTGAVGRTLGKDPVGFRVFKVYKDRVEHKYYPLDQVPEKISL